MKNKIKKYGYIQTLPQSHIINNNIDQTVKQLTKKHPDYAFTYDQNKKKNKVKIVEKSGQKVKKVSFNSSDSDVVFNFSKDMQDQRVGEFSYKFKQNTRKLKNKEINQKQSALSHYEYNFKNKIKKYRVNNLVSHFVHQLKRTTVLQNPTIYQPFDQKSEDNKTSTYGLSISKNLQHLFRITSIVFTFLNCLLATFLLLFLNQIKCMIVTQFISFSIVWIIVEILFGFFIVKEIQNNTKIVKLKDICLTYLKKQFIIDLVFLVCICFYFLEYFYCEEILFLGVFAKLPDAFKKCKILESKFIKLFYQEQHWGLVKMFIHNFFFIHVIAVFYLLMTYYQKDNNWVIRKGIQHAPWFERYVWSFYWAATTMLTVGFGDIVAANYKQALSLVLIQTISCMTLAYNINLMGKFLGELRKKQISNQKDIKLLKQLCDNNQICPDLQLKLTNHITQSHKMQRKFNFDQQQKFIQNLPSSLKLDLLRQSNFKIVSSLHFLRNFTNKTIQHIAERLSEKMMHPWQIVYKPQLRQITILKQGVVGLCPNFGNEKYKNIVINKFESKQKQNAAIISMDFARILKITRNYDYKSVGYSLISSLEYQQFLEILKKKSVDWQYFFTFKEKERKDLQIDTQLIKCQHCKINHSKFICPKLHYEPIPQKIIYQYLNHVNKSQVIRKQFQRYKHQFTPLKMFQLFRASGDLNSEKSLSQIQSRINIKLFKIKDFPSFDSNAFKKSSKHNNHFEARYVREFAQDVKAEVLEIIQGKNKSNFGFWQIELDVATDYQYYFPKNNPKCFEKLYLKRLKTVKRFNIQSRSKFFNTKYFD